jgi:hypothetical protein
MNLAQIQVTGDTYSRRERLRELGYVWNAAAKAWCRTITDPADLAARTAPNQKCGFKGCAMEVKDWNTGHILARLYGDGYKTAETRMGCDACGDDAPAVWTPKGWLCDDCRKGQ